MCVTLIQRWKRSYKLKIKILLLCRNKRKLFLFRPCWYLQPVVWTFTSSSSSSASCQCSYMNLLIVDSTTCAWWKHRLLDEECGVQVTVGIIAIKWKEVISSLPVRSWIWRPDCVGDDADRNSSYRGKLPVTVVQCDAISKVHYPAGHQESMQSCVYIVTMIKCGSNTGGSDAACSCTAHVQMRTGRPGSTCQLEWGRVFMSLHHIYCDEGLRDSSMMFPRRTVTYRRQNFLKPRTPRTQTLDLDWNSSGSSLLPHLKPGQHTATRVSQQGF